MTILEKVGLLEFIFATGLFVSNSIKDDKFGMVVAIVLMLAGIAAFFSDNFPWMP